ncbi:unnamed protein product, partial [Aphanomyces euteiches]
MSSLRSQDQDIAIASLSRESKPSRYIDTHESFISSNVAPALREKVPRKSESLEENTIRPTKKKFGYVAAYTRGSFRCSSPLVVVKPSTIPGAGFGVFAAVELLPGDIVTWYS